VLSIVAGVWCVLNRLSDIRKTARLLRNAGDEVARLELKVLGKRTWCLFYVQVGSFTVAILLLFVAVVLAHRAQVF